ncbi:recombinase RecT [Polynucleobacter sp. IMCC 29146]|uniref:recombinase RecT n=1 Tax=Polynucleobacter sp. IMCC 29146 TaxID=2780953 RepID=UPI001F36AFED|nr:recombinase RecT [Polynucleobacter sp. IMCC 29146]MCE7530737.1 recombinase RecT [Polynucleobacter sp. IMCC 29146]
MLKIPKTSKIKANPSPNPLGKRTHSLKELVQRDFVAATKECKDNLAPVFNLVNIQEDLIEDDVNKGSPSPKLLSANEDSSKNPQAIAQEGLTLPIKLLNDLIKKEVGKAAKVLELEETELQAWIDLQVMTPKQTLLALLRIAIEHHLDPLKEEVTLALYEDTHWQAYITVEGYCKILNSHPAFDGITFKESPQLSNDIPLWMECTIYRKDRSMPTIIREYFEEVKGEQTIWQKMPRRMLRHRVMQQCARLSFG